jgi:predicted metal-dependent peptidase
MGQADQELAWNEVQALVKNGGELTIYYTDADVEHTQKIKPYKRVSVEDYQGKGGGGTDLDNGIVRAIEEKNDIVVLLTDGMTPWNLQKKDLKGKRVITVTTVESAPKHYGPTIKVESK